MLDKRWTYLIVGLGQTGLSCVRFLSKKNVSFAVVDSRATPPGRDEVQKDFPHIEVFTGELNVELLKQAQILVVSPGIPLYESAIVQALDAGCELSSDVELFLQQVSKPVVAITGSNGKSTVVSLLGEVAKQAQLNVPVVGNVGVAVLGVLNDQGKQNEDHDGYILELSSFQLERLQHAQFTCASILNVSEDHLDRYADWRAYVNAKQIIYRFSETAVINRDDHETYIHDKKLQLNQKSFGLQTSAKTDQQYGLKNIDGVEYLMQGDNKIIAQKDVKIPGRHNTANALAVLAISQVMGWQQSAVVEALKIFTGLDHRCQYVNSIDGVDYINDSKGTNVGASLAAIEGLCANTQRKVVLIVGGEGKGADFSPLVSAISDYGRAAVVIGTDGPVFFELFKNVVPCEKAQTMEEAVSAAQKLAEKDDYVLLSPACASFDMFDNYMHRGEVFASIVNQQALVQEVSNV